MNKLQREIELNKVSIRRNNVDKKQGKVLIDGLLGKVSGGWVNFFSNWSNSL